MKSEKSAPDYDRLAATHRGERMDTAKTTAFEKFQAELQKLKNAFAKSLPSRLLELEALRNALGESPTAAAIRPLERALHSLAGSGATFGFPEVSRLAKSLELILRPVVDDPQALTADTRAAFALEWEALRQALGAPSPDASAPRGAQDAKEGNWLGVQLNPVLALDNEETVAALKDQMRHYAIDARFLPAADHEGLMRLAPGAVVVYECDFSPENTDFLKLLGERCRESHSALFVVSSRGDTEARLAAARAGVDSYFTLPFKISALLDRLDPFIFPEKVEPPRVLIVDDDVEAARYAELILKSCGMLARVQTSPFQVLGDLESFAPDCILMDIYMPQCDGPELAKVIRQIDAYMSIPIVFLSMEQDVAKQVSAVAQGGDDFLIKPVKREFLTGMIRDRIRRYRIIRSLMTHDGLTGLLNHTNLKLRLAAEIDRAKRLGSGLAFAMIDIDHFKAVNDTYGHAAGDRVIRTLSRFLQRKLRRTDVVGRYGGEEFAVTLTDLTEPKKAMTILDALRQEFSEMPQYLGETPTRVTFSCGVAFFTGVEDAETLCTMADTALYQSKRDGRNRVTAHGRA